MQVEQVRAPRPTFASQVGIQRVQHLNEKVPFFILSPGKPGQPGKGKH